MVAIGRAAARAASSLALGATAVLALGACGNASTSGSGMPPQTVGGGSAPSASIAPPVPTMGSVPADEGVSDSECPTGFDEARIVDAIKANYSNGRELPIIAALEIFKTPDLAESLGAGPIWWKAQIATADAYIEADRAVAALGDDSAGSPMYSYGHYLGDGMLACAKRGMFVEGLKMARDRQIDDNSPAAVTAVTIDGTDVPLSFLGLPGGFGTAGIEGFSAASLRSFSTTGSGWMFCADGLKPVDASQYASTNPRFADVDGAVIQIEFTRAKRLDGILRSYLDEIGATCE